MFQIVKAAGKGKLEMLLESALESVLDEGDAVDPRLCVFWVLRLLVLVVSSVPIGAA